VPGGGSGRRAAGADSRIFYLQIEQQVLETEHGIEAEKQHLASIKEELAALDKQRAETDADYRKDLFADLSNAETQESEHAHDVAKAAQKHSSRTLRAPVDGTVQQLTVHTIGGVVTPAEHLMVIVPKESKLEIEVDLANKDVGFVHKGQEVEIKVEAFTFTRYGLLHGTVTSVSQDAVAPQDVTSSNNRSNAKGDPTSNRAWR
jgi:hemolysin D